MWASWCAKFRARAARQPGVIAATLLVVAVGFMSIIATGFIEPLFSGLHLKGNLMELTVEAVAYLCMFLLLLGVMGLYRLSLASTGLETRPTGSQLLWPLWLLPIYFFTSQTALEVLQRLFPSPQWDTSQQLGFQSGNAASLALIFIGLVVIPPLVEETLFRGFLYTAWRRKFGFLGCCRGC